MPQRAAGLSPAGPSRDRECRAARCAGRAESPAGPCPAPPPLRSAAAASPPMWPPAPRPDDGPAQSAHAPRRYIKRGYHQRAQERLTRLLLSLLSLTFSQLLLGRRCDQPFGPCERAGTITTKRCSRKRVVTWVAGRGEYTRASCV
eukprot:478224-Prorocentrum_minimum.AAC.1